MREDIKRALLNTTVIDIEAKENTTTFYLESERGMIYSVDVKSGETVERLLKDGENQVNHTELSGETHCNYCCCPKEIWKKSIMTYNGDECQLYESFLSLAKFKLSAAELTEIAIRELPKEFSDITDIDATVKELMDIILECGILENPYPQNGERR